LTILLPVALWALWLGINSDPVVAKLQSQKGTDFFASLTFSLPRLLSFGPCEQVNLICERLQTPGGTLSSD
jgi:hypothetical protein